MKDEFLLVLCFSPTRPHLFDSVLVDQMMVLFVEGAVQRNAVGLKEQILQGVDSGQAQRLLNAVRQVRVIEDHLEAEHFRSQGDSGTDSAETHDAQRIVAYSCASRCVLSNLFRIGKLLSFSDHIGQPVRSPVEIQDQTERCVGDFFGSVAGHIADGNAQFTGRFYVDIIHVRSDSYDDFERFELDEIFSA